MSNVFSSSKQSNIPWTLESALAASVSDGTFVDVELSLFSRRLAAGKVGHPRPVYANSAVLKRASSYFHGLLEGGFVEGDVYAGSPSFPTSTDEYDYESDSDLEDDGIDETDVENEREVARGSEDAPPSPQAGDETRKGKEIARPHSTPARETSRPGLRRVMIKNSAFNTWQWVIVYMYTGQVVFAQLKSQGLDDRASHRAQYRSNFPNHPLPCSPKSMYRLADILGLDDLKTRAIADFETKLSMANIYTELFTKFSSRNDAILHAGITFFEDHCMDTSALPPLQRKLELISAGDFTHGVPVVLSLFNACISINKKKKTSPSASKPPKAPEHSDTGSPAESEKLPKGPTSGGVGGGLFATSSGTWSQGGSVFGQSNGAFGQKAKSRS